MVGKGLHPHSHEVAIIYTGCRPPSMATGKSSMLSLAVEVSLSNRLTGSCLGVSLAVMKHNDQKQLGLFHLYLPSHESPSQEVKAKAQTEADAAARQGAAY